MAPFPIHACPSATVVQPKHTRKYPPHTRLKPFCTRSISDPGASSTRRYWSFSPKATTCCGGRRREGGCGERGARSSQLAPASRASGSCLHGSASHGLGRPTPRVVPLLTGTRSAPASSATRTKPRRLSTTRSMQPGWQGVGGWVDGAGGWHSWVAPWPGCASSTPSPAAAPRPALLPRLPPYKPCPFLPWSAAPLRPRPPPGTRPTRGPGAGVPAAWGGPRRTAPAAGRSRGKRRRAG